jgi:hypothetical protein
MPMGDKGQAFARGGCGCLAALVALGLLFLLVGGNFHIDIGGAIMLFVLGGLFGLFVLAVYNRGRRDADRGDDWQ